MELILQIESPGEWEKLLAFLQQQSIAFRLNGKNDGAKPAFKTQRRIKAAVLNAPKTEAQQGVKLAKNIVWEFSNYTFPVLGETTFRREEIYEDANWEKDILGH